MTIKQQGGIFGRNPTFNEVDASTIDTTGDVTIGDQLAVGTTEQNGQLHVYSGDSGASRNSNCNVFIENDGAAGISIGTPSANSGFLMFADEGGTGRGFIQYDHTTDYLNLAAAGSTRVSIQGNNIALNNGGGIDFSATSGTGTSELFDDYEEGSWTPTLTTNGTDFGSVSYDGRRGGSYTKIGRVVHIQLTMITDSITVGSASGNVVIGGLPFPPTTTAGGGTDQGYAALSVANGSNWTSNPPTAARVHETGSYIELMVGATFTAIADANTGSNDNYVNISGTYITD